MVFCSCRDRWEKIGRSMVCLLPVLEKLGLVGLGYLTVHPMFYMLQ